MGIEISGNNGRPPHEAVEASQAQRAAADAGPSKAAANNKGGSPNDQLQLSDQAAQLKALEAEIANLPVVDTRRVQDVQRVIATGSFEIQPARVADKMLTFEAGLGKAQ